MSGPITDAPTHNLQGQVVGPKGQRTRLRLIETLQTLVNHRPLRDLRVMDICKEAKTSPGTFYLYFKDVQDLALETIRIYQKLPAELEALLAEHWPTAQTLEFSRRFVEGYTQYWGERYHLLHTRNLTADEGDTRMTELRYECVVPLLEKLAEKIREAGNLTARNEMAAATVIMSSLERLASVLRVLESERGDITTAQVIEVQAWVLATMLGYR